MHRPFGLTRGSLLGCWPPEGMAAFLEFDDEPDQEPDGSEAVSHPPPPAGMPQWASARPNVFRPGRSDSTHPVPPPPESPGLWNWIDLMSGLLATITDARESWWAWVRSMMRSLRAWGVPSDESLLYRHVVRAACQSSVERGPHWRFWGIGHRLVVGNPWNNDLWPHILDEGPRDDIDEID